MAIEEFGKSLLADVRKRKDDQARDARRREERNALKELAITGVVSIGNSMLKDKANSFLESEQFYKENMQFKKGHGIASEYITNEKLAREDTLGYDAYWSNVAPSGQVDAAMVEKYGDIKKYSTADWKANRSELMKEIGRAARKNHEDGLATAQSFINQAGDKGAEFYADFAKQSRPTTLKDLIMNKAKEALGGNDLNVASRELTRKGYLGDAQTLIAYDKAWDATGNNQVSAFLADTSKTLGGAAPIIKEDFEDMGGTDSLGLPKGKEKVYKAVYWDGSERYVNEDGQASSLKTVRINKKYNNWVSRNSTNSAAATEVQGIGKSALTDYGTPEDIKFFTDLSKEHGKGRSGKAREKAIEDGNRNTQASIAGLKLIFNDDYGMSEQESSRLAVIMHRRKIESREAQKESGVLGANPYSHANALGIALVMAEQQSLTGRPRDFSDADIQEVVSSPSGLRAMFEDYSELTPTAMNEYTELVKQSKNPYLLEVHNRMKRFVGISKEKNTQNLSEIYTHYETEQLAKALPVVPPELSGSTSTLSSTTVVPEIVPISKLVKPDAVAISRGSSFLNPMSGKSYAKKIPTQLEAYNKLLALQTVTQRKKQKADESTAALKPEFRNRIGTPQKSAMKSILDLQKAYEDYITKYGE
jgi:hypothetical protein